MDVCGIDPGLGTTGYAVLSVDGDAMSILDAGVCRTDADAPLPQRLVQLERDIVAILEQSRPQAMGVEQLYAHYAHPRTAILMGHARGVILSAAAKFEVPVYDFGATQVKRFLTGNGRASKVQMQRTIQTTFGLASIPEPNDVADAIAVGYCCARTLQDRTREAVSL
jgi:crossover junction endodeoxyribonuclease RuvC